MKILVAIKRVIDANVKVRVKDDHTGVERANAKMAMNPFCEIAVEEAVRLKERGVASEIVALCIGENEAQEQLRSALALGADRAILVEAPSDSTLVDSPLNIAKIIAKVAKDEDVALILLGKQAIDNDNNQTAQMVAALLDYPQATFASKIEIDGNRATIVREIDGGLQTLAMDLPCVVSTDLRLNEPRYPKLPNIMAAKKKPIDIKPIADFAPSDSHVRVLKVEAPQGRKAGIQVASVDELIEKLANDKVI